MRVFPPRRLPGHGGSALLLALAACYPVSSKSATPGVVQSQNPLRRIGTIDIPDVTGRLDHLALDKARGRLYVSAYTQGALVVVDVRNGSVFHIVPEIPTPQGLLYLPDLDRLIIASGERGTLEVLGGEALEQLESVPVGRDVDNLRYDAGEQRIYYAWGGGAISAVDAKSWKVVATYATRSKPEGFQLSSDGERIFANLPAERSVVVFQREDHRRIDTFPIREAEANFPLALLENDERVAIGCRNPPRVVVFSARSGTDASAQLVSRDVDDLFYDRECERILAVCGEGAIDVFGRKPDGEYRLTARADTATGARTGLWDAEERKLYVAIPQRGVVNAQVAIFEVAR